MIVSSAERDEILRQVSLEDRIARFGQRPVTLWLQGEQAAITAIQLERKLFDRGHACIAITERAPHELAAQLNKAGLVCICVNSENPPADSEYNRIVKTDQVDIERIIRALDPATTYSEEQPDFDI